MSVRSKNPRSEHALPLTGMVAGRSIILISTLHGVGFEGRIIRAPYVVSDNPYGNISRRLVVDLVGSDGTLVTFPVANMGVIPYSGSNSDPNAEWSIFNYTIDARKRSLLPSRMLYGMVYSGGFMGSEEEEEEY